MPTGYTWGVANGEIATLRDYALTCARAFGALVIMRDESPDAEIPEKFEVSDYHEKKWADGVVKLAQFKSMRPDELIAAYTTAKAEADQHNNERRKEKQEIAARYEAMLAEARAFIPPTPDHEGLKNFMVTQLEESIPWDTDTEYNDRPFPEFEQWVQDHAAQLEHDVQHHLAEHAEEVERTRRRNEWIAALRTALENHEGAVK